jgi:hypothetical protein
VQSNAARATIDTMAMTTKASVRASIELGLCADTLIGIAPGDNGRA